MAKNNKSPSITIPETDEPYYSEWDCHDLREPELMSVEVIYDDKVYLLDLTKIATGASSDKIQFICSATSCIGI